MGAAAGAHSRRPDARHRLGQRPTACLGTRRTGDLAASWPRLRSRLVVDFGAPVVLDLPEGIPGRARLELATEQIRTTLVAHVHAASGRHGIPLPTDVPPDLLN